MRTRLRIALGLALAGALDWELSQPRPSPPRPATRLTMRRFWYAVAGVLALVGCLGLTTTVPAVRRAISPRAEPAPLPLQVTGSRYDRFTVDLDRPGRYAVWATRPTTAPDRDRCGTTGPDGRAVPTTEPGRVVEWTEVATDDTLWSWLASVDARPPAGTRSPAGWTPTRPASSTR
ncbi:hypothetical protein [Micromonospora sp. IBHARD004]|uniref:hypothetical protein n=1 Tax=Micromonospora sp. IBHARD004 TaxID=3457764 RepID=UPI0040583267